MKRFFVVCFSKLLDFLRVNDLEILISYEIEEKEFSEFLNSLTKPAPKYYPFFDFFCMFKDKNNIRLFEKKGETYRINPEKYNCFNTQTDWHFEKCLIYLESNNCKIVLSNNEKEINSRNFLSDYRTQVFGSLMFGSFLLCLGLSIAIVINMILNNNFSLQFLLPIFPIVLMWVFILITYKLFEYYAIQMFKYHFKNVSRKIEITKIPWRGRIK